MSDCIFCRIVKGEIPSKKVYEDEDVLAFNDVNPMAPIHVLVIPKKHVESALEAGDDEAVKVLRAVKEVARITGADKDGFRLISNVGENGCQSVHHMHVHVLGGTKLSEKLG